jgi:hypothetical protein
VKVWFFNIAETREQRMRADAVEAHAGAKLELDSAEFQLQASSSLGAKLQERCIFLKQALRRCGAEVDETGDAELGVVDDSWVQTVSVQGLELRFEVRCVLSEELAAFGVTPDDGERAYAITHLGNTNQSALRIFPAGTDMAQVRELVPDWALQMMVEDVEPRGRLSTIDEGEEDLTRPGTAEDPQVWEAPTD